MDVVENNVAIREVLELDLRRFPSTLLLLIVMQLGKGVVIQLYLD
jgi:hypothetical protein